jgi:hypothetical protein
VEGVWLLVHWGPFCGVRIRAYHDWWGIGSLDQSRFRFWSKVSPSGIFIISLFGEWGLVLGTESSPHLRESQCLKYIYFKGGKISPNFDPKNIISSYIKVFSWKKRTQIR